MSLRYEGTFTVAGVTMPATSSLTVTPHPAGGWAVAERAQLPRGVAVDSARLDVLSLAPRERIIQQGTTRIALRFAEHLATGTITTGDQTRSVSTDVSGWLVGDGAGAFLVNGRLPLRAGYRATLRHFDIRSLRTTSRHLAVVGSDQIAVPAGRFDTWVVEISNDGSSAPTMVWLDKASLVPVRFSAPQGSVTIAMQLVPQGPDSDEAVQTSRGALLRCERGVLLRPACRRGMCSGTRCPHSALRATAALPVRRAVGANENADGIVDSVGAVTR